MILLDFSSWWAEKEMLEQIYWCFAIPSSLAFVIIILTTFIGGNVGGDAGDADMDVEADEGIGFQFFTIKNMVGFFTIFSWTGLVCIDSGYGLGTTLIASTASGTAMMAIMAFIFYMLSKLVDSGTMDLKNAIGNVGEVYLPIKGNRDSFGKVQINVQGQLRTLDAMTDGEDDLRTGVVVEVLDIINNQILLVAKSKK